MSGLRVEDFDFELPPELIAQQPPAQRGSSRMLLVDRSTGALRDARFAEFPSLLKPGDLLVLNDSRVIPARLYACRVRQDSPYSLHEWVPQVSILRPGRPQISTVQNQARIEVLLTEPAGENRWRALVKPGKKVGIGDRLNFFSQSDRLELEAEVTDRGEFGERTLEFKPVEDFFAVLERIGHMPLPPYIRRSDADADRDRYQTVFSRDPGSVAAPTAGLHFTPEILDAINARGVEIARITLHVGLGTFAPLRVETLDQVRLHREHYTLSPSAAEALNRAVRDGRRIVAAGTTVVRTLEHCAREAAGRDLQPHSGETEIFISPGFEFRVVNALLTNFHLPQSSLLMLVSALAGRERVLASYHHAVAEQYHFFSYGDCMFIA